MKVAGYIFDLDGTIYRDDRLTFGACQTIRILQKRGRKNVFLSNKPLFSRKAYAEKLWTLGIPAQEDEVITSSCVLARELAKEDGEIPDAAAVIAAPQATTGRKVEKIFGKPSRYMIQTALEVLGLPPEKCAMVGDRLETDIRMAKEKGLTAILVFTGVTRPEDLRNSPFQPDYVLSSLAELPALDEKIGGDE